MLKPKRPLELREPSKIEGDLGVSARQIRKSLSRNLA